MPRLSLGNKLCSKTEETQRWSYKMQLFFPKQMCKFRHIENLTTIRPAVGACYSEIVGFCWSCIFWENEMMTLTTQPDVSNRS